MCFQIWPLASLYFIQIQTLIRLRVWSTSPSLWTVCGCVLPVMICVSSRKKVQLYWFLLRDLQLKEPVATDSYNLTLIICPDEHSPSNNFRSLSQLNFSVRPSLFLSLALPFILRPVCLPVSPIVWVSIIPRAGLGNPGMRLGDK